MIILEKKLKKENYLIFIFFELKNPKIDKKIYDYIDYGLSSLKNIKTFQKVIPSKLYEIHFL